MTDPAPALRALRADFPHWAFLHTPAQGWIALRGKGHTVTAATAEELAHHLTRMGQHRPPVPADVKHHPRSTTGHYQPTPTTELPKRND